MSDVNEKNDPLARALAQQQEAAELGFDWPDISGAWAKLYEELQELEAATSQAGYEHELGDVFFTLINLCRFLDVDPRIALEKASLRFEHRFAQVKAGINASDGTPTLEQMERWWQQAKLNE